MERVKFFDNWIYRSKLKRFYGLVKFLYYRSIQVERYSKMVIKTQPIQISIWQAHDYTRELIDKVTGMQYNQAPPDDARDLLYDLDAVEHPQQIGKLRDALKELEAEIKILAEQTYQTQQAIIAWNVPEYGDVKRVYKVSYPLNEYGYNHGLTTVEPVKNSYDNQYKYKVYDLNDPSCPVYDYPSLYGYDS